MPQIDHLRSALTEANYTADGVLARIGELGQEGLGRNMTLPAEVALGDARDPLATLIRVFILQQEVAEEDVAFLSGSADDFLEISDGSARALVDVRPYGSPDDGASGWVVSDLTPGLNGVVTPTRPDYVLGVSPASTTLAQMTMRTEQTDVLDLGTGCGVQSLHLAQHSRRVVATDVNERALQLAAHSAALTGVDVDFRLGSLFEPVAGEQFDLIVSNPPYVMSPPTDERLTYRETSFEGDGLLKAILEQAPAHLKPGGHLQLLTNWAVIDGQWEERLRAWAPELDLWVIERERLDKFTYIEMWLTDAGLSGSKEWRPAYLRWLAYFDALGIEEVGMGWILATKAERETPHVRMESWPYAVQQPVGEVFVQHRAAVDASLLPVAELLATRPKLVSVEQETLGEPGAEDPAHIVFRQTTGLRRGLKADTAEAAVFGALDGELAVGQVIGAVASLLDLDMNELAAGILPKVRDALAEQYLRLQEG